jgi:hypothetical protein
MSKIDTSTEASVKSFYEEIEMPLIRNELVKQFKQFTYEELISFCVKYTEHMAENIL